MSRSHAPLLTVAVLLAASAGGMALASPDLDYETVGPVRATPAVPPSADPPGLVNSPLVVTGKATGPRLRLVMRDGTILVGQVLACDGQMYALRLAHSTLLVRRDLFTSVGPVAVPAPKRKPVRVAAGARS